MKFKFPFLSLLLSGFLVSPLSAQETIPEKALGLSDEVFATQGGAVLTQAELDYAISRIPADLRLRYLRKGERVDQMIAEILRTKLIALEAEKAQYDEEVLIRGRLQLAMENELADAWLQHMLDSIPEADYESLAYEYYLASPEKFMLPETVDVSHILISGEKRQSDEALQLALDLRQQIIEDPSRFDALVMEFSDDPSKSSNAGRFPNTRKGQMVKAFEEAAFAMETPGEISEPVATAYGYHLIRLNAKNPATIAPFESVKAQAMLAIQKKHKDDYRVRYVKSLIEEPIDVKEGAVDTLMRRYYGENLELMPNLPQ